MPHVPSRCWKATIPDAGGAGMSSDPFQTVREGWQPRLADVLADILPGGRVSGKEYVCAFGEGGRGNACRTNRQNGVGSDFATGECWSGIISLAAPCWRLRPERRHESVGPAVCTFPGRRNNPFPAPECPLIPALTAPPAAQEPPRRQGAVWAGQATPAESRNFELKEAVSVTAQDWAEEA